MNGVRSFLGEGRNGDVAVITGAGNGIGAGLARQAVRAGMKVVLADVDISAARARAAEIGAPEGTTHPIQIDVTDAEAAVALAARVEGEIGPVRLLINNAGIEMLGRAWELSRQNWQRIIDVNLTGPVNMVRAFLPAMANNTGRTCIANVCSIGALVSVPMQGAYIATKHALLAYTECLRLEVQQAGLPISVSAVLPGPVRTGIFEVAAAVADVASEDHRNDMKAMLADQGMSADEAANHILEGVFAGRFWVATDADLLAAAASRRGEWLAELREPELRSRVGVPNPIVAPRSQDSGPISDGGSGIVPERQARRADG